MRHRTIWGIAINTICAVALVIGVISCPRSGIKPPKQISMKEYIETFVPHAGTDAPLIPVVLEVAPVVLEMELKTPYHPNKAFKGSFTDELREGAIAYFGRKAMFVAVGESGGELSLHMRVTSYEVNRKTMPENISMMMDITIDNVKLHQSILYGKFGSKVIIPFKDLDKIVRIPPPGGGNPWVVEQGAFELAKIYLRTYQNIETYIRNHRYAIIKSLDL